MLRLILSGGQTGVDQAAFRAAQAFGLLCAGWCPPDRSCETGEIPQHFPVQPTHYERNEHRPDVPRSLRTEWNVRDSDGTLIFCLHQDVSGKSDPGTVWTQEAARLHHRPVIIVEVWEDTPVDAELARVTDWIESHKIQILNVAGPSTRNAPTLGDWSYHFLLKLFAQSLRDLRMITDLFLL